MCHALTLAQPPISVANARVRTAAVEVCQSVSVMRLTRPLSSAAIMLPNARQNAAPIARISDMGDAVQIEKHRARSGGAQKARLMIDSPVPVNRSMLRK